MTGKRMSSNSDYYSYLLNIQNRALKETLAELEQSRNRYADLFDYAPVGYITLDNHKRIIEINHFAAHLFQQERYKLLGMPLSNFIDEEDLPAFYQHLDACARNHEQVETELCLKPQKGKSLYLQLMSQSFPGDDEQTYYKIIVNDITEKKGIEQKLSRMEQLHLAGQMAASIAHEIRNPLATVTGFLQLLQEKQEMAPYAEFFIIMIDELKRANHILAEFLALARDKSMDKKKQQLNDIIRYLYPLLDADAGLGDKRVFLQLNPVPELLLDDKEIRQLIINLVQNGLQAMEAGKKLVISTFCRDDRVFLSVKDEGPGISPDLIDKVGTPFFTTKEQGTGLGLAVCYSIAGRHNALIEVDTGPSGTTIHVKFKNPDDLQEQLPGRHMSLVPAAEDNIERK